jgi:hypothetical protein
MSERENTCEVSCSNFPAALGSEYKSTPEREGPCKVSSWRIQGARRACQEGGRVCMIVCEAQLPLVVEALAYITVRGRCASTWSSNVGFMMNEH